MPHTPNRTRNNGGDPLQAGSKPLCRTIWLVRGPAIFACFLHSFLTKTEQKKWLTGVTERQQERRNERCIGVLAFASAYVFYQEKTCSASADRDRKHIHLHRPEFSFLHQCNGRRQYIFLF